MRAIKAYTKSSSFVVSFVFISLLMLGVGFNIYTLRVANDDLLIRESEAAILADIGGFRSLYNAAGRQAVLNALDDRLQNHTNDFLYYLKDEQDNFLAGNLSAWPSDKITIIKNGVLDIQVSRRHNEVTQNMAAQKKQKSQRAIAMLIEFSNKDSLLVARSVQDIEFAVAIAQTSSWVMIIILCVVALSSLGLAYYVVSRINKISETTDDIIRTGDLSDRLHVDSSWDDLSKLTLALNQLLDKIEHSVRAISSVSDNIAHDLRTPLTRLKSHIENIKDDDEKQQLIAECDSLLAVFNSLLRISDIENTEKRAGFTQIALDEVALDAVDLYSPLVEDKGINMTVYIEPKIDFYGDKNLMFQAFANVLDNAIKFTPSGGEIHVALNWKGADILFSVDDSGIGVDKSSIEKLTRRFFREEKSRSTSGNGLGLALVSAIVTVHEGKIWFEQSHLSSADVRQGLRCAFKFTP
jgi:signal transduction histidine kinase